MRLVDIAVPERAARLRFGLWLLGVVLFAPPLVELGLGRSPFSGSAVPLTWDGFADGTPMRRVEKAADPMFLRDDVLPSYREALFRATGRTNRAVVVGQDGWLFFRDHMFGYATPEARVRVERLGRLAAAAAEFCAERGGLLLTVPIPNKETLVRDRFAPATPPPGELYTAILGAWRRQGLGVVDLRPALDPSSGAAWFKTDTHWTYAGARAGAVATAESLRGLRDEGALGPRSPTEFRAFPPVAYRGDLFQLLGFPEKSSVGDRYFETAAAIGGLLADGTPAESATTRPLVVAGSSASLRFGFAGSLGAELGLAVETHSADGSGFAGSLLALLREVDAGLRPMPRAIVWEFVERSVQYEASANEREFTAWLEARGHSSEFARNGAVPLAPSDVSTDTRSTDVASALSSGADSLSVSAVEFGVAGAVVPCDGSFAFSVRVESEKASAGTAAASGVSDAVEIVALDALGVVVAGPYVFVPRQNGGRITLALGTTAKQAADGAASQRGDSTPVLRLVPPGGRELSAVRFAVRRIGPSGLFRADGAELRGRRL